MHSNSDKNTETPANLRKPAKGLTEDTMDANQAEDKPREIGGRDGLEPTRYGDWEKAGRCIDF